MLARAAYEIAWPLVFERITRRVEQRRATEHARWASATLRAAAWTDSLMTSEQWVTTS